MPRRSAWDPEGSGGEKAAPDPRKAALQSLRFRTTDLGVKLALDLAAAGEQVVYASDWDPGTKNLERLAAANVETHAALRVKR